MNKLKIAIEKYSRWQPLSEYINRIEGFRESDFSVCVENSKSVLEAIAKEICKQKNQTLVGNESVNKVLSLSFGCLGYAPSTTIRQIGTAITNVAQQMGNFRNEIGVTSHGRTLEELKNRTNSIDELTGNFLIESTDIVCCFLIEAFETDNPLKSVEIPVEYEVNEDFNEYWDNAFESFIMGDYSFLASEILFYNDPKAYKAELNAFNLMGQNETDNRE